jgi:protein kinase-like protein
VIGTTVLPDEEPRGLDEVIGAYFKAVDRGEAPDPLEWQERYPVLTHELAEFFKDQARLGRIVTPLEQAVRSGENERTQTGVLGGYVATESRSRAQAGDATLTEADAQVDSIPERPPETPPRRLGDFELIRPLGRGAMGVVYEARQLSLNRRVAIKLIRAGDFATEAEVQRFHNEAEAVAHLDHPRIVSIHEVGKIEDCRHRVSTPEVPCSPSPTARSSCSRTRSIPGRDPATGYPLGVSQDDREFFHVAPTTRFGVYQALSTRSGEEVISADSL